MHTERHFSWLMTAALLAGCSSPGRTRMPTSCAAKRIWPPSLPQLQSTAEFGFNLSCRMSIGIEGAGLECSFADGCTGRLLHDVRIFVLYATRRISMEWDHGRTGHEHPPVHIRAHRRALSAGVEVARLLDLADP